MNVRFPRCIACSLARLRSFVFVRPPKWFGILSVCHARAFLLYQCLTCFVKGWEKPSQTQFSHSSSCHYHILITFHKRRARSLMNKFKKHWLSYRRMCCLWGGEGGNCSSVGYRKKIGEKEKTMTELSLGKSRFYTKLLHSAIKGRIPAEFNWKRFSLKSVFPPHPKIFLTGSIVVNN